MANVSKINYKPEIKSPFDKSLEFKFLILGAKFYDGCFLFDFFILPSSFFGIGLLIRKKQAWNRPGAAVPAMGCVFDYDGQRMGCVSYYDGQRMSSPFGDSLMTTPEGSENQHMIRLSRLPGCG